MPRSSSRSVRARLSRAFSSAALACERLARAWRCWSSSGSVSISATTWPSRTTSPSATAIAVTRPGTCEASFTSWFGSATMAPRTTSGSTRSRRATTPVSAVIVGTSGEAISSVARRVAAAGCRERRDERGREPASEHGPTRSVHQAHPPGRRAPIEATAGPRATAPFTSRKSRCASRTARIGLRPNRYPSSASDSISVAVGASVSR